MTQSATPLRGGSAAVVDLMLLAATLLFVNGQTTARTIDATARLAGALGFRADLLARWGELTATIDGDDSRASVVSASPLSVDMGKVAATLEVTDQLCDGHIDADGAQVALQAIQHRPPIALARFASLAAAGAAALGVIFGEVHLLGLIVIALSAGAGALLRRWLAGISANPFVQPLCAALLAGAVGAVVVNLQLSTMQRLVAVCPCMVLVPGPHLLNGAIDLARARIALGAARILYAGLIIVVICTGLLVGLALGGVALPVSETSVPVPLPYDVIAAGVAVAAYGTFFSMTWRTLPIPIVTGMIAHAARWATISLGGSSVGNRSVRGLLVRRNRYHAGRRSFAVAVCSIRVCLRGVVDPRGLPVPNGRWARRTGCARWEGAARTASGYHCGRLDRDTYHVGDGFRTDPSKDDYRTCLPRHRYPPAILITADAMEPPMSHARCNRACEKGRSFRAAKLCSAFLF